MVGQIQVGPGRKGLGKKLGSIKIDYDDSKDIGFFIVNRGSGPEHGSVRQGNLAMFPVQRKGREINLTLI